MKVYVMLKSSRCVEALLWFEHLEESLFQMCGSVSSYYQIPASDILAVHYNPIRQSKVPYSIHDFHDQVDPALVRATIAKCQAVANNGC
jgi:hypothetical protein